MGKSGRITFPAVLLLIVTAAVWSTGCAMLMKQKNMDRMEAEAIQARDDIRQQLTERPDSELRQSLKLLDSILNYAARVKTDPGRFDPDQIEDYSRKIEIIRGNIERFKDPALRAKVSFPEGRYEVSDLSAAEKRELRKLTTRIARSVTALHKQYPEYEIRVILKTIGYTDETPVASGSRLEKNLRPYIDKPASSETARRRQYNRALSYLRARKINRFLQNHLPQEMAPGTKVRFVEKALGMGEEPPIAAGQINYGRIDPRRRICMVLPFIGIDI